MRAFLLAAGLGTRLRPLTQSTPKCLVPIAGKPLLDYWLDLLFAGGIERVLINTHYLADAVRAHVVSSAWRGRIDLAHEDHLLGTGGSLAANRSWCGQGPLLLAHADNLTELKVTDLAQAHAIRAPGCVMTMATFQADDPRACGIVQLDGQGVVQGFFEKVADPPGTLANAAAYILEPEVMDFTVALGRPVIDFSTEVIPRFIGRIQSHALDGYHRDIGSPESLALAREAFPRR